MVLSNSKDEHGDWVAFRDTPASFEARSVNEKRSVLNVASKNISRRNSGTGSWMGKPINADASWVPVASPAPGTYSPRPSSPQGSRILFREFVGNRKKECSDILTPSQQFMCRSSATQSSSLQARKNDVLSGKKLKKGRSGSSPVTRIVIPLKPDASILRTRTRSTTVSSGEDEDQNRCSQAQNGARAASAHERRGRSKSRSRHSRSPSPRTRSKSVSGNSQSNNRRRRSSSRPPVTRPNTVRESRVKSRSSSLTRITSHRGPTVVPSPSARSVINFPHASLSTTCHRRENGSTGPGMLPCSKQRRDPKIGRDISFGTVHLSDSSSVSIRSEKSGLFEKVFGFPGGQALQKPQVKHSISTRPRILLAATVYHNTATGLWITTINTNQRGVAKNPAQANKFLKAFSFPTEKEARESAIANAPPKMVSFQESAKCFHCRKLFAVFKRACHCRNCGVCICASCSISWPAKMLPETYNLKNEASLKVCTSCGTLSSLFKKALLEAKYEEAIAIYETGNVNLRTPFPPANKKDEVLYPIHAAIEGGNLKLARWLVEDRFCPLKQIRAGRSKSDKNALIQTSKGRTVLSIAMEFLRIGILRFLVVERGISVFEATDTRSALRTIEAALVALPCSSEGDGIREDGASIARWDQAYFDDMSEPSSLEDDDNVTIVSRSVRTRTNTGDCCIICMDHKINCVATPCGHQVCCLGCSASLSACPVCNNRAVEFIKIFRP